MCSAQYGCFLEFLDFIFSLVCAHVFSELLWNSPSRPYYYWYHLCFYIPHGCISVVRYLLLLLKYMEQWKKNTDGWKPKDSETTRPRAALFTKNSAQSGRGSISVLHDDRQATNHLSRHLLWLKHLLWSRLPEIETTPREYIALHSTRHVLS